jgi:hypothetical protein
MAITANKIIQECNELKTYWNPRKDQFEKWYDLLTLKNNLEQEDMESVIANDPRAIYDLALRLLTSNTITHKISTEGLEKPEIIDTSYIERYINSQWQRIEHNHRRIGRQSWLRELMGLMLVTGWYSIFVYATKDDLIAEIWNPANVFPEFGSEGLTRCVHIYSLSAQQANRKAIKMGWDIPRPFNTNTTIYNYYYLDGYGRSINAIVAGTTLVKPPVALTQTEHTADHLPIFVSPVGGLPDSGAIKSGSDWKKHYGESILAPNVDEFENKNRMLTFQQQLVRDTANPRWYEKTRSGGILDPTTIFKRGPIYTMTPEEDIGVLPVPPIPIELRTMMFDYDNRIQREGFPWVSFGNIQQQMTGYMVSQISAIAIGVVAPYADGLRFLLSDIDSYWFNEIRKRKLKPYKFKMPANIPSELEFQVDFTIDVPGSLMQRITAARMLNPTFRLGFDTTVDMLFPEIRDPIAEQAKANRDEAMTNPIAQALAMITAYREEARLAKDAGDTKTSALFTKAADALEAQLSGGQQAPTKPPTTPPVPREVAPREELGGGMLPPELGEGGI